MYKPAMKEVLEARPMAIRFAGEIGKASNARWKEKGATMAGMVASLTFQNILTTICLQSGNEPGSAAGLEQLSKIYDAAKQDALDRWNEEDLKYWRKRGVL